MADESALNLAASLLIQRHARGMLARFYVEGVLAATFIQSMARGMLSRNATSHQPDMADYSREISASSGADVVHSAAVLIQSAARGLLGRISVDEMIAVTIVQSCVRGWLTRAHARRVSPRSAPPAGQRVQERDATMDRAVVAIQASVRGMQARQAFEQLLAATFIQCVARGMLARVKTANSLEYVAGQAEIAACAVQKQAEQAAMRASEAALKPSSGSVEDDDEAALPPGPHSPMSRRRSMLAMPRRAARLVHPPWATL